MLRNAMDLLAVGKAVSNCGRMLKLDIFYLQRPWQIAYKLQATDACSICRDTSAVNACILIQKHTNVLRAVSIRSGGGRAV